jgi:hypothetical protein
LAAKRSSNPSALVWRTPSAVTMPALLIEMSSRSVACTFLQPLVRNMTPDGVEANRRSLELVIDYAFRQKIIPRKFAVDELFDDTMRVLRTVRACLSRHLKSSAASGTRGAGSMH